VILNSKVGSITTRLAVMHGSILIILFLLLSLFLFFISINHANKDCSLPSNLSSMTLVFCHGSVIHVMIETTEIPRWYVVVVAVATVVVQPHT